MIEILTSTRPQDNQGAFYDSCIEFLNNFTNDASSIIISIEDSALNYLQFSENLARMLLLKYFPKSNYKSFKDLPEFLLQKHFFQILNLCEDLNIVIRSCNQDKTNYFIGSTYATKPTIDKPIYFFLRFLENCKSTGELIESYSICIPNQIYELIITNSPIILNEYPLFFMPPDDLNELLLHLSKIQLSSHQKLENLLNMLVSCYQSIKTNPYIYPLYMSVLKQCKILDKEFCYLCQALVNKDLITIRCSEHEYIPICNKHYKGPQCLYCSRALLSCEYENILENCENCGKCYNKFIECCTEFHCKLCRECFFGKKCITHDVAVTGNCSHKEKLSICGCATKAVCLICLNTKRCEKCKSEFKPVCVNCNKIVTKNFCLYKGCGHFVHSECKKQRKCIVCFKILL